jgi:outer membrane protein
MRRAALACALALACTAARAETPLTLAEAIRIARASHPAVATQRALAEAARGRRESALAPLLPYATGGFTYAPQTPNFVVSPASARLVSASIGTDTVVDTAGAVTSVDCRSVGVGNCRTPSFTNSWDLHNYYSASVGLAWTLWDWGRSPYGLVAARRLEGAADTNVVTAGRDVALGVAVAFYGAVAADEQVGVAFENVRSFQWHVAQIRAFHDAGLRTGIDVATVDAQLASARFALARAQAARETARALLAVALGEKSPRDYTLVTDPREFEPGDDERRALASPESALEETALAARSEPAALRLQAAGFEAQSRSVRGAFLPQLSLALGPTWAGLDIASLTPNFTVALALAYPAGGMSPIAVHGQLREARGNLAAARAAERAEADAIRAETRTARALVASAVEEIAAARAALDASDRQRALAEGRYQTGIGNVIELTDAVVVDVNARYQMVQARLDLATARARLAHALGRDL